MFSFAEAAPSFSWTELITSVVMLVITAFLVPFLRRRAAAAKAEADKLAAETTNTDIRTMEVLVHRLKQYLWGSAEAIAEREFPKLAARINSGELKSVTDVKAVLHGWGAVLKQQAIDYFQTQGVDLIAAVGDKALDRLIERAANAVSPFPGKDTAVALLRDNVTDALIGKGVEWVRRRYLSEPTGENAPT